MAEDSFTDKLQRAQLLHNTVAGLVPVYFPGPPVPGGLDVNLVAFQQKINTTTVAHENAEDAVQDYGNMARDRVTHLETILSAATSVLGYLRSRGKPLANTLRGAEKIVDRMRGPKEAQPEPEPPAPGEPPEKKRNRGQQSYMEQAGHLRILLRLVSAAPGYNPASAPGEPPHAASAGNLSALLSTLRSYNSGLLDREADVIRLEGSRQDAFEDEDEGLHPHFLAVKEAVKSQYGYTSTQFGEVQGIEW